MPTPDPQLRIVSAHLRPGEHIQWSGRPDPSTSMMSKAGVALFALAWLAVSGGGLVAASRDGAIVGMLFALLFVGIGLFMLILPGLEYHAARRTIFAITEHRLIIATKNGRSIKSIQLSGIRQVERIAKRDKVTLRIPTALVSDGEGGQKVDYTDLHGLRDGDRAFRLLTEQAGPLSR